MVTAYMVFWTWHGDRRFIDFDDESMACAFALMLAEAGREDISVSAQEYRPDPERAERIRKRINERLAYEWAIGVVT